MRTLLRLTLCVAAVVSAAGCGFESEEPAAEGGELRFISGSAIKTLDPQATSWLVDFRIIEGLFEPLLRVNPETMAVEPSAAEAMPEVSDDGLVYTFTVRPDAAWSNGEPLLASDYAYGWFRALLADLAADYSALFFCIEGAQEFFDWRGQQLKGFDKDTTTADELWAEAQKRFEETVGIEAVDERTLRVTLKQPTAYFNELVAFAPFSPVHRATASAYLKPDPESGAVVMAPVYFKKPELIVSNGPYRLGKWRFKQSLTLEQNPYWWNKDQMGNTRVVMLVNTDPVAGLLRYNQGEAHWYPGFPTASQDAAKLVEAGRADVSYGSAAGTYFYAFNCQPTYGGKKNPFADVRVRRAFSMAIDRQTLVQSVTRLNQPVARTFIPPDALPGYEAPVQAGVSFDPEGARKLLAEAGYPGGAGLSGITLLLNSGGGHEKPAQSIRKSWEEHLGVTVQIEAIERINFSDRLKNQGFQVARAGWFGDYRDPTTFLDKFHSRNNNNDSKYANPEYDRLLDAAATELDSAARMGLLAQAEAILMAEQPLVPLYHYTNLELFDPKKVRGLMPNPWNIRRLDAVRVVEAEGE